MHAILTYGFPLILLLFEWGLRAALTVDTSGFFGPTLAAAALSYLVPLTRPYEKQDSWARSRQVLVTSRFDASFVAFTWLLVLLCLFAWAAACYCSLVTPADKTLGVATHISIGGGAYIISLVMTSIKERN